MKMIGILYIVVGIVLILSGVYYLSCCRARLKLQPPTPVVESTQSQLVRCYDIDFNRMNEDLGLHSRSITAKESEAKYGKHVVIENVEWWVKPEYCRDGK